jgi:acyl carrier protein
MAHERSEIVKAIAQIINEETGVDATRVVEGASFAADLDIDSLDLLSITTRIEEHFNITIADTQATALRTVGEAVDLVASLES